MKLLHTFILFSCFTSTVLAQNTPYDPFIVDKRGPFDLVTVIRKSGFTLTRSQIVEYLAHDPNMLSHTKPLAGLLISEMLLNTAGSMLTAWPLIQLEFLDREPNLDLTYIGLGTLAASLILKKAFMSRAERAVKYYNNGYRETARLQIRPVGSRHGLGLALVF